MSMPRVKTKELQSYIGQEVLLSGWLQHQRSLGGVVFTLLRDGWGICQLVSERQGSVPDAPLESVITVTGVVIAEEKAPGGVEVHLQSWSILAEAEPPPLVMGKRELHVSQNTLLNLAPVSLRHPSRRSVFRVSAAVMNGFRTALEEDGFTEIASPKIVCGAAEGGANVFAMDYFGRKAYLAQSPQLYKQMMVGVFERVFEIGPVFRAEPHDTIRHLNQYISMDAESGFITDHHDVMAVVEMVVKKLIQAARVCPTESWSSPWVEPLVPVEFPKIAFWEVPETIRKYTGRQVAAADDLAPQDERDLGAWAKAEFSSDFLFVTGYPMSKRPFYTHPDCSHPGYSNSFDLLFRGTEIVTGGQRLHRYSDYLAALQTRGINAEPFTSYLSAFKHGMPPHGGFGMGLERFVAQLLGINNVREATLFPRTMNRLEP